MAKPRNKKIQQIIALLVIFLVFLTVLMGILAVGAKTGSFSLPDFGKLFPSHSQSPSPTPDPVTPSEVPASGEMTALPQPLRAVTLRAVGDFSIGDAEKTKGEISAAIQKAKELTMNALVLSALTTDGQSLYPSTLFSPAETGGLDVIDYAQKQAKTAGMAFLVIYPIAPTNIGTDPVPLGAADAALVDRVYGDVSAFAKSHHPDAILLDGYYNKNSTDSFVNYLALGGGIGYEAYRRSVPEGLVRLVASRFAKESPRTAIGLLTEAVWANDYEQENGSATKSTFSTLTDGNADTVAMLREKLVDFVVVNAAGSLDDPAIPYEAVLDWWGNTAAEQQLPLYLLHAAEKAATDAIGWGEYDQLSRQIIAAEQIPAYTGSIFNGYTRLVENPKDCTGKLIGYYAGTVKKEHILQDLELIKPSQREFTSFDPSVLFTGNTDPNTDATINGTEISIDENGYFQLEMPLQEGDNTFNIVHKGKTARYDITRITDVVKEVSPGEGTLRVDGGIKLTFTAVAYDEAEVYAVIAGKKIPMEKYENSEQDDPYRDTAYSHFKGTYTVPAATGQEQPLGSIVVYGEWDGIKKSKKGASVVINKRILPSDGTPVVVVADFAESFSNQNISHYSDPTFFPLPKGAIDYAIGNEIKFTVTEGKKVKDYAFYRLQSGQRVLSEDIAAISKENAVVDNRIESCTVTSDARYTKVILETAQKVSYTGRYDSKELVFQFNYTNALPDSMKLTNNPWFSAVDFSGGKMTLTLRQEGRLMGMQPYYDSNGNLVLQFNNPPGGVRGAEIVIDPGHGGNDSGALGYLAAYPEKVVNFGIASQLASILQNQGAKVSMLRTGDSYSTTGERLAATTAADPQLFISVHSNSSAYNTAASGSEAYYFNLWSSPFSQYASANLSAALGNQNRGGKHGYYHVTRSMQYPAILVETGFMSNPNEYHKLVNSSYQASMAQGLANAISSYFSYMGTHAGLTGTQKSTCSVPLPTQTAPPTTEDAFSIKELGISEPSVLLSVGESETITALWDSDEPLTILWEVSGDKNAVSIEKKNDKLTITAKASGTVILTASVQGAPELMNTCRVKISG